MLRRLRPRHAGEMFAGLSDPAGYCFLPDEPPESLAALHRRYLRQAAGGPADGSAVWLNWIVRRGGDDTAIGYTQATIADGSALIGYQLFPVCWGRGLGTRAVRLTLDAVFARADVRRACALVDTRNLASVALLRRLGFLLQCTVLGADHFKGVRSDEHEFVLERG